MSVSPGNIKCTLLFGVFQCEHTNHIIYTTKWRRIVHKSAIWDAAFDCDILQSFNSHTKFEHMGLACIHLYKILLKKGGGGLLAVIWLRPCVQHLWNCTLSLAQLLFRTFVCWVCRVYQECTANIYSVTLYIYSAWKSIHPPKKKILISSVFVYMSQRKIEYLNDMFGLHRQLVSTVVEYTGLNLNSFNSFQFGENERQVKVNERDI